MKKIAVLTSGKSRGSNFLAIYNHIKENKLEINIDFLLVTDMDSPVVKLAQERSIDVILINPEMKINDFLIYLFTSSDIDLIVLAGFMRKINSSFFAKIKIPVVNIHPALLPKFGGKGMYGMKVHQAVFDSKEDISGATVHYVNAEYDKGSIILQETCDISDCVSPEEISQKVLKIEHSLYIEAIKKILF